MGKVKQKADTLSVASVIAHAIDERFGKAKPKRSFWKSPKLWGLIGTLVFGGGIGKLMALDEKIVRMWNAPDEVDSLKKANARHEGKWQYWEPIIHENDSLVDSEYEIVHKKK